MADTPAAEADTAPMEDLAPGERSGALTGVIAALAVATVVAVYLGVLQFHTRSLVGYDGYFHIKFSYLMAHGRGLIRKLPWLQYTIHRDYYRDHHLLFHVLYIPFTFGDLRLGAKVAAWFYATLGVTVFYLVAARRGRPAACILTLVLLGASARFLNRMMMPRVPALSMTFLLLGTLAVITRRHRWLAVIMVGYVWLYDGFVLLLGMMACFFLAELILDRRANWRLLAWGCGGMIAGMVINPYFPKNVSSYFFNLVRTVTSAQVEARTGAEWYPLTSWFLFTSSLGIWVAFGLGATLAIVRRRPTRETLALFFAACLGTILAMKAKRHLDTWPQLVLLFLAWSWGDFRREYRARHPERGSAGRWATAALALLVAFTPVAFAQELRSLARERPYEFYEGAARYLRGAAQPGTLVFTGSWDDFPFMFFFNSDCYYVVGLDKLYMKRYDAALFKLWTEITSGSKFRRPSRPIHEKFGAKYLLVNAREEKLLDVAARMDGNLKEEYRDQYCAVFRVIPP